MKLSPNIIFDYPYLLGSRLSESQRWDLGYKRETFVRTTWPTWRQWSFRFVSFRFHVDWFNGPLSAFIAWESSKIALCRSGNRYCMVTNIVSVRKVIPEKWINLSREKTSLSQVSRRMNWINRISSKMTNKLPVWLGPWIDIFRRPSEHDDSQRHSPGI